MWPGINPAILTTTKVIDCRPATRPERRQRTRPDASRTACSEDRQRLAAGGLLVGHERGRSGAKAGAREKAWSRERTPTSHLLAIFTQGEYVRDTCCIRDKPRAASRLHRSAPPARRVPPPGAVRCLRTSERPNNRTREHIPTVETTQTTERTTTRTTEGPTQHPSEHQNARRQGQHVLLCITPYKRGNTWTTTRPP